VAELEIGVGKSARRGYALDEVAIVPSRRTRDAVDVDISWQLESHRFALPLMAAPMDGVVSPETAIAIGALGGIGVLNLEGLWTRYEDPTPYLDEIASLDRAAATPRLQEIYAAPVQRELIVERVRAITDAGIVSCGAVRPQRAAELADVILESELDVLVIQGTVVSAEHVSKSREPLNLKKFIRELDIPIVVGGCNSYQSALHLMRTGAVAVLVGVGTGGIAPTREVLGIGAPQATAIADAAGARSRHLEETGVYVHVVADGGMERGGDIAKAIACGADAVMIGAPLARAVEAPGAGHAWGAASSHPSLPRGGIIEVDQLGTLEEILAGPGREAAGELNLFGALRASMAMCGYASVREFHKADVVIVSAGAASPGGPEATHSSLSVASS
jgi:IMP dehydrogenase